MLMAQLASRANKLLYRGGKLLPRCGCCCQCNATNIVGKAYAWCCTPPEEIYATVSVTSEKRTKTATFGFTGTQYTITLEVEPPSLSWPVTLTRTPEKDGCAMWSSNSYFSAWPEIPAITLAYNSGSGGISVTAVIYNSSGGATYKRTGYDKNAQPDQINDTFSMSFSGVASPPELSGAQYPCERLASLGQISINAPQLRARTSGYFNYWNDVLLSRPWSTSLNATISFAS